MTSDLQQARDEIGQDDRDNSILKSFTERVGLTRQVQVQEVRDTSNDTIWGNSTWLGGEWDNEYSLGFILGSSLFGVLGESKLGVGTSEKRFYNVSLHNNTFRDDLYTVIFNDSDNSNAEWLGDGIITFGVGSLAQTKSIARDGSQSVEYSTIEPQVTHNLSGIIIEVTADGGDNWATATNNTEYSFVNRGYDVQMRVSGSSGSISQIKAIIR